MYQSIHVVVTLSLLVIAFCASADTGTDGELTMLKADDLKVVAAGELVYQAQCAVCHGAQLEGQPDWRQRDKAGMLAAPPHDASGHTWHHADDLLFEITKYGPAVVINDPSYQSNMPVYDKVLSDEDIIAVLSYIKNSWPEEQRGWQEEVNGTQAEGFTTIPKKPSLIEKILK